MQLPPINFLLLYEDDVLNRIKGIKDIDKAVREDEVISTLFSSRGDMVWSALSFLRPKEDGRLDVRLTNKFDNSFINVGPTQELLRLRPEPNIFVVGVQADFRPRLWVHYHIVQNEVQLRSNCSFIPHWPQPGLIQRDVTRIGVKVAAYIGQQDGNLAWTPARWQQLLRDSGVSFLLPEPTGWYDMSNYDVVIAVRSFDERRYNNKPPSKLLNAWHAGVPFIGGVDSAYDQVGVAGETHFRARSPDEVIGAIQVLQSHDAYDRMIRRGRTAAQSFTAAAITNHWIELFSGPIADRYERWRRSPHQEALREAILSRVDSAEQSARRMARASINLMQRQP